MGCSTENKPANQKCKQCADPKPKKSKNKKSKRQTAEGIIDDKWTNNKCPCGSNKKYKKCCKKLEKHGYQQMANKNEEYPEMQILDKMQHDIERAELQISHFKGKKTEKMKLIKALQQAKNKRDALQRKLDKERNRAIKWKNKQKQEREYNQQIIIGNGYKHKNGHAINKSLVGKTIALCIKDEKCRKEYKFMEIIFLF